MNHHGNFKHGESGPNRTREYRSWGALIGRCYNSNDAAFNGYGGRQIKVCIRWRNYIAFITDMGRCPPGYEIDRIDNDGNYSCGHCEECLSNGWPMNCKWSLPKEQAGHRRSTHWVTINGVVKPLTIWCQELGIPVTTAWNRLNRGIPPELAFNKSS